MTEHVLLTVPIERHDYIRKQIAIKGVIKALVDDVIPEWTEEQKEEALNQLDKDGVYKTVLGMISIQQIFTCSYKKTFVDVG